MCAGEKADCLFGNDSMTATGHGMPSMALEAECPKTEHAGRFSFCGRLDVVRLLEDASRMPISAMSGI